MLSGFDVYTPGIASVHQETRQIYDGMVKKGCGLRTVQVVHSVIHRVLVHAVKLGTILRNPDDATTPPKPRLKEMKHFDENQAQQFLITAQLYSDRFYALFYLAIATGMRQGELLGLKWRDLDWEQGSLHVKRQLTKKKGGGYEFTIPKTKAGTRQIDLGAASMVVLREHQHAQYSFFSALGDEWHDNDLIFPSQKGTPADRDNLRRHFK